MTVMANRFFAPKGSHIGIKLPAKCLSVHIISRALYPILLEVGMPKFV